MAQVRILAGDIEPQKASLELWFGALKCRYNDSPGFSWTGYNSDIDVATDVDRVEVQTEDSVKTLAGTASWAAAGALLAGPLGAVIGGVFGGHKKEVCFAAYLKDGRRFLAVADSDTFRQIQAAVF